MKLLLVLLLFLTGCTTITHRPDGSFSVSSFANKRKMDSLAYTNAQTVIFIRGYHSDQTEVTREFLTTLSKAIEAYLKTAP